MSSGQPEPTKLPRCYSDLGYKEIIISNHPASSKEPTPVLLLTINRPKNNNAFTDVMTDELEHFFGLASIDDRVKAIVVTGQGRLFCAGQDLQQGFKLQGNGKNEDQRTHRDGAGRASLAIHNCTKPTIGAINGHAIGAGITMTLPMVMRVVWEGAKIGFVFSRRGVVMEGCGSYFLPRLVGHMRALHLTMTGATYLATHDALEGLFTEKVKKQEDVVPRALEMAQDLAENTSTVSTFMLREMLFRGAESAEEAHLLESRVMGHMRGSHDNDEGTNAFLEKRNAKYTGTVQRDAPPVWPWYNRIHTKNLPVADPSTNGEPKL